MTVETAQPTIVDEGLMTVVEAAEFLAVGRSTIYQALDRGDLPSVKLGRCRRIPRAAVRDLANRNLTGGNSGN